MDKKETKKKDPKNGSLANNGKQKSVKSMTSISTGQSQGNRNGKVHDSSNSKTLNGGGSVVKTNPKPLIALNHKSFQGTMEKDSNIVRAELLNGVELNKVDKIRRILSAGVDPNSVCDDKGRWPLHIAALLGYSSMVNLLLEHGAEKDQPDTSLERTPLLYAAATSIQTVQVLLNHRANIRARNKFGATALHYAAGAGEHECVRLLASSGCDVNGRDRQKMTPLHMAARVNESRCIDILLEYGCDIHARDIYGKNALHHAAETCEGLDSNGKMGETFKKLVAAGVSVNEIDLDGKTALFYAVQRGSAEGVSVLYELGSDLIDGMTLLTMSKKFPHLIRPFLDKCLSSNIETCDGESKEFYIQFDYTCLTLFPKDVPNPKLLSLENREETESILSEMGVLHGLTKCKDTNILAHPLCQSLIRLKWKKVKWYLYLDMLLFALFLAFLTGVIFMEYESDDDLSEELLNNPNSTTLPLVRHSNGVNNENRSSGENGTFIVIHNPHGHERYCMDSRRNVVLWIILWVLTTILGIRELVQLIQAPLHYILQIENILELTLVSSVALLSLAECGVESFVGARDHFAAVCLIVGWTIQVTLYGKIPVFGVYIRMFGAVGTNILKCMFTYLGLLFAFSLTLHFLFRTQKDFDSVGFTFLKTFAMMIGEIDLARIFIDSRSTDAVIVPFTSHIVIALFIIFISIILSSLFIALAVCDISSMQRDGEHMQIVELVKVASQLESALQKRSLLYPQFGIKDYRSLHQRKGVIFPNLKDHGKLSKDAIEIIMTQHIRKLDSSHNGLKDLKMSSDNSYSSGNFNNSTNSGSIMKITDDLAHHLLENIKGKIEQLSLESHKESKRSDESDELSLGSARVRLGVEVLLIKSQLEDMSKSLREVCIVVKQLLEKSEEQELEENIISRSGSKLRRSRLKSTSGSKKKNELRSPSLEVKSPQPEIISENIENEPSILSKANETKEDVLISAQEIHEKIIDGEAAEKKFQENEDQETKESLGDSGIGINETKKE